MVFVRRRHRGCSWPKGSLRRLDARATSRRTNAGSSLSFRHFGDGYAVLLLSLWIGIGFIFQGVSGVAAGISESDLPGRGWYVVAGIISVLAGLVVLVWPFNSIAVLTLAAGICLVIIGITQIVHALQNRKHGKTAQKTIDEVSNRLAA